MRLRVFFGALALASATLAQRQHASRWHLQRIRQRGPVSAISSRPAPLPPGRNPVNIYVVDSGLRVSHEDFGGRAELGPDFVGGGKGRESDCQGHGSSVGALAAGKYSGIARDARLISVRVLDCKGVGFCTDVVKALNWIKNDTVQRRPARAVVVMSLGSRDPRCEPTIQLTRTLARSGVLVVAASGNSRNDSCDIYPARSDATLAVGATDKRDRLYKKNNMGACVDILAPGVRIIAAWGNVSDSEYRYVSGTSHATPLVAGTAAYILAADPSLSTRQVRDIIVGSATIGRIRDASGKPLVRGEVNRLLFTPWASLFEEIPRDARKFQSAANMTGKLKKGSETNEAWELLQVDLSPKVAPAMQYSANMVRNAVAKAGGFASNNIIVRRGYRVKRSRNGKEPSVVRLHIYVRNGKRGRKSMNDAVRSGQLMRLTREKVRFVQVGRANYLHQGVVLPHEIYDRPKQPSFSHLDSPSIVLSAILSWILFMFVIGIVTSACKGKFASTDRNIDRDLDGNNHNATLDTTPVPVRTEASGGDDIVDRKEQTRS